MADTRRFRCPKCGSSHFGSTITTGGAIAYRNCHDEFSEGCHWRGDDSECMVPDPVAEAREIIREVVGSGVSFEDERIKYKEVQLSLELLKDARDWLSRNGGEE